jgi:flagellar biosynthesis protein FlhF
MTINKYQGKTKEEAVEKARQEMGNGVVILNVKEIKPKGIFGALKKSIFEVTAAMEEREQFLQNLPSQQPNQNVSERIDLAADEQITVKPEVKPEGKTDTVFNHMMDQEKGTIMRENNSESKTEGLEKRLENLSNILEKQLSAEEIQQEEKLEPQKTNPESFQFIKMLYRTLLDNDVNEKYVNQVMEEAEKILRSGSSVDYILSSVYQKMILKFGQPSPIQLDGKKPRVIFFIGPTGVGKTTTIAKIASRYKVEMGKRVAFLTADTYRIAATEQLRVYANILDAPMSIIYSVEEMNEAIGRLADYDLVFVDTAGFSHKSESQCQDMKKMLAGLSDEYEKEVYLVVSATTKYKDLLEIADIYKEIADYKLIFTKLDETSTYGNILNIRLYSGAALSYMTYGQNVPDDIEEFDTQKIVKQLLGGR